MIRNLFKRKKPLVKKKQPITKTKRVASKEPVKKPTGKVLTAEGWKRLMLRPKAKTKKP
jgi:hypothetical protein